MTDQEKIDILLKEYETLREEIIHRTNNRLSFLTYAGAVGTYGFFSVQTKSLLQTVVLFTATAFLLVLWYRIGLLVARCSHRIAEIETEVNRLANAELLQWETRQHKQGIFHRFHK